MSVALRPMLFLPLVLAVVLILLEVGRQRRRAGQPRTVKRIAFLDTSPDKATFRTWRLGMLATALPICGTAAFLKLRWQTIPERFPIHWGINGQPNGWAHRGIASTFGVLLLAALLVAILAVLGEVSSRVSPGFEGRAAMLRTMRSILLAVGWFLTFLCCAIGLLPLTHNPTNFVPLITVASVLFSVGVLAYIGYRSLTMATTITASQDATNARFWKANLFYVNSDDSALMVPKRYGFGYTLNFGRPISWLILAVILLVPLVLPVLVYLHGRH